MSIMWEGARTVQLHFLQHISAIESELLSSLQSEKTLFLFDKPTI
jgi:hypothetical protein